MRMGAIFLPAVDCFVVEICGVTVVLADNVNVQLTFFSQTAFGWVEPSFLRECCLLLDSLQQLSRKQVDQKAHVEHFRKYPNVCVSYRPWAHGENFDTRT